MFKRWVTVLGMAVGACLVLAFAALSLRPDTASRGSTTLVKKVTQAQQLPKPTIRLEYDKAQPVPGSKPVDNGPALDSLSVEQLVDMLDSQDNEATKRAARKLETIPAEAVPALIKRLSETFAGEGGKFNKLRWWCVNTLGDIKDKQATEVLVKCAALDEDPHTRWRSIWALNVIGDDRRIALLKEHLASKNELERFNAATALSTMDIDDGVKVIEEATKSSDTWLRWQAVSALGKIKSPETLRLLAGCLKDPEDSIRQEAAMSLGRLEDKNAAPALIEALGDSKPGVRWRAARSLGQLGARDAIGELTKLLDDPDGAVRGETAVALGDLGCKDRDVAKKVIEMLSDPDRDVRSNAAIAIGKICTSDDLEAVNRALANEKEDRVRSKLERSIRALKSLSEYWAAPIPAESPCITIMRAA